MKKTILLIPLTLFMFFAAPAPEAKAFDPATMSLATTFAMSAFQKASPLIIKGLTNLGKQFIKIGKDIIDIFRLPIGLGEIIFMAPFGFFKSGVRNLLKGAIAPAKLCIHALLLPVVPFVNINI